MTHYTSYGVVHLVLARSPAGAKPLDEPFLLYENSFQRTWLLFMTNELVCILDDVTKGQRYDPLSWRSPYHDVTPVRVRPHRRNTGLVDFGDAHAEWLYSVVLHPDPADLQRQLEQLMA